MKSSNPIVMVVVAGAVLIAAYAVGLLIRQARVGDSPSSGSSAAEVNEPPINPVPADLSHAPGAGRPKDSQEARIRLKEKRAETLQKMESATEEEKTRIREQTRQRFETRPGKRTPASKPLRPAGTSPAPAAQDPNTPRSDEKTDSEPNRVGTR